MARMVIEVSAVDGELETTEFAIAEALDWVESVRSYWIHREDEYPGYLNVTAGGANVSNLGPGGETDD